MNFSYSNQQRILWLLSEANVQKGKCTYLHPTLAMGNPLTVSAIIHKGQAELTCMANDMELFMPDTMAFRVFIELSAEERVILWPSMYKDDDIGILHGCSWEDWGEAENPVSSNQSELVREKIETMLDVIWRRYKLPKQNEPCKKD